MDYPLLSCVSSHAVFNCCLHVQISLPLNLYMHERVDVVFLGPLFKRGAPGHAKCRVPLAATDWHKSENIKKCAAPINVTLSQRRQKGGGAIGRRGPVPCIKSHPFRFRQAGNSDAGGSLTLHNVRPPNGFSREIFFRCPVEPFSSLFQTQHF